MGCRRGGTRTEGFIASTGPSGPGPGGARGQMMRQAKPDDVFTFVGAQTIADHWARVLPYLGQKRAFWTWLLDALEEAGRVRR